MSTNPDPEEGNPDPDTGPGINLDGWEDPPNPLVNGGGNPQSIGSGILTKLDCVFKDTPGNDVLPVIKRLSALFQVSFGREACILPYDPQANLGPITAQQFGRLTKESLPSYYPFTIKGTVVNGILRITIPASSTFLQWKRETAGLFDHLVKHETYWKTETLADIQRSTPIFLTGVPVDGANLEELSTMVAKQCSLDPKSISLRTGRLKRMKGGTATYTKCILLDCPTSNEKQVAKAVMDGLSLPLVDPEFSSYPISRCRPMTMKPGLYRACGASHYKAALEYQDKFLISLTTIAWIQLNGLENKILTNGKQRSIRDIIYNMQVQGEHVVHMVNQTHPGRVLFMVNTSHKEVFNTRMEYLFYSIAKTANLANLTGFQDKPRRPTDPALFPHQTNSYLQAVISGNKKINRIEDEIWPTLANTDSLMADAGADAAATTNSGYVRDSQATANNVLDDMIYAELSRKSDEQERIIHELRYRLDEQHAQHQADMEALRRITTQVQYQPEPSSLSKGTEDMFLSLQKDIRMIKEDIILDNLKMMKLFRESFKEELARISQEQQLLNSQQTESGMAIQKLYQAQNMEPPSTLIASYLAASPPAKSHRRRGSGPGTEMIIKDGWDASEGISDEDR